MRHAKRIFYTVLFVVVGSGLVGLVSMDRIIGPAGAQETLVGEAARVSAPRETHPTDTSSSAYDIATSMNDVFVSLVERAKPAVVRIVSLQLESPEGDSRIINTRTR